MAGMDSQPLPCPSGKIQHDSVQSARRHILKLSRRGKLAFGSHYKCPDCGAYHVTSKPADGVYRNL